MSAFIDLDAARRESRFPDGIPVRFGGRDFIFPAELPADALDPLLSDDLDLVGLLRDLVTSPGSTVTGEVFDLLLKRPNLPRAFLDAVKDVYLSLLGPEQFEQFIAARPWVTDYIRLSKALSSVYGVTLGKLFGLSGSSESDGETSNPTSPASTDSTPEGSGDAPDSPDSSASAA
ncbi:hypothetical protein G3I60_05350 [Streptomyces sp. SID13666]|uniref:hypothetical protein n=1 Tax=Streptomyces sp. SID13666 TaxID=2706054 RepID=UPI0013C0B2E4|nr:hypothetical protein [Streptomyces sp. SID13666]NEA53597.1 hypothetical protein [Streptomyces sp. SID13666]